MDYLQQTEEYLQQTEEYLQQTERNEFCQNPSNCAKNVKKRKTRARKKGSSSLTSLLEQKSMGILLDSRLNNGRYG
tara:strand:+ start:547 stop:774 length:228 start_codon:yes stop_codon:yes gene_type:complete